jgi:ArsR family transcriptional regulator, arsenate/arsenite/antimonite-responsive transcriptional repressor
VSSEMSRDVAADATRLKALGHPVRLGIAMALAKRPGTCACDFAEMFDVSQPTVSEHLRVLREAGLVTTRRRGTQIFYSLDPSAVRKIESMLRALRPRLARISA